MEFGSPRSRRASFRRWSSRARNWPKQSGAPSSAGAACTSCSVIRSRVPCRWPTSARRKTAASGSSSTKELGFLERRNRDRLAHRTLHEGTQQAGRVARDPEDDAGGPPPNRRWEQWGRAERTDTDATGQHRAEPVLEIVEDVTAYKFTQPMQIRPYPSNELAKALVLNRKFRTTYKTFMMADMVTKGSHGGQTMVAGPGVARRAVRVRIRARP